MAGDLVYTLAFYGLAALCLSAAAGVIFNKNLVHSALCLALAFIAIAGLYILLQADFLAAAQVLVYNGAVAVMITIGVMLTQRGDIKESSLSNKLIIPAAVVTLAMVAVFGWAILSTPWAISSEKPLETTVASLAKLLFGEYVVPFEVAALLLLVAMIGAITLAKGADE